jgi:hypothetical protein
VFAGGTFTTIGGQPRHRLAAVDAQGAALSWNPAPNGNVDALAVSGSVIYAGGEFTGLYASTRKYLAALDRNGVLKAWNPNADGPVLTLALSGATVYAGGSFTTIGGQPRQRLAAIDAGGNPRAWNPGADWPVRALALWGSTVYVGGEFYNVAGQPRNRLAAIDTGGALLAWNPSADRAVHALAIEPDLGRGETIYAGGEFSTVAGRTRRRLAAIDVQGAATSWNPQGYETVGDQEVVYALRYADGVLYAGGLFSHIGPQGRRNLAAIGFAGDLRPWAPAANNVVWTLAVSGRTIYVGGEFTQIYNVPGVVPRNGLAAIDIDGTLKPWDPNASDPGHVYSLGVSDGAVHAGGSFSQVGDRVAGGFVTLVPATATTAAVLGCGRR